MTKAPTRKELDRMMKQCDANPTGNTWNATVANLIRHYLDRLDELEVEKRDARRRKK